ncbi:MAG: hypothetical protein ACYC7L_15920 [Nitrospirota bacterium]
MRGAAIAGSAVLFLVAGSFAAIAQQGPMGSGPGMRGGGQQVVTPEQFPDLKARALKNIDERIKRMGEHRACIEKAQTHEEMRNCRPEPPMGGGPMHRGPREQRPPQTGGQQQ